MLLRDSQTKIIDFPTVKKNVPSSKTSDSHRSAVKKKIGTSATNTSSTLEVSVTPLWLKALMLLGHGSSLMCYGSLAILLVVYGMTVYAPRQWTEKYGRLRELQKQERQLTFTDEVLKNKLGELAGQSGFGFIKPDPTMPPVFLPDVEVKSIELPSELSPVPKEVQKVFPIAY